MSWPCWDILGLAPTPDGVAIRRAYAKALRQTNPEDDPEGFKALRDAYEQALQEAAWLAEDAADEIAAEGAAQAADAAPAEAAAPPEEPPQAEPAELAEPQEGPAPDPELVELQALWQALIDSFAEPSRPDPAALAALIRAPAMDRIAVRANVEGEVARLIAQNLPAADALVRPAIAGFGWGHSHSADRGDWAVNRILERDVELHPSSIGLLRTGGDSAPPEKRRWRFRLSWSWFAIFIGLRLLIMWADSETRPDAPLAIGGGVAKPVAPGSWFQGQRITGIDRREIRMTIDADVAVNPDGTPHQCRIGEAIPADFARPTCDIIMARSRFEPAAAANGDQLRLARVVVTWDEKPGDPSIYLPTLDAAGAPSETLAAPPPLAPPQTPPLVLAEDPVRRGPECPADPPAAHGRDPVPCGSMDKWVSVEDFPQELLLAKGTRTLKVAFEIGRDGFVQNCHLPQKSGIATVDLQICKLLRQRAHFLPGRDAKGRARLWNYSFTWGWETVTKPAQGRSEMPAAASTAEPRP
ncbi:MAG: hypothetical protein WCO11_01715 [Sphingomonadales bacterium]